MSFDFTPEQAVFLALLIGFISPVFQVIKRLAALPYVASTLTWIYAKLSWVPGSSDDWQRITLYGLASGIAFLFNKPILPAFPATVPVFELAYATEVLIWVESVVLLGTGFVALVTGIYHYFYKGLFKAAAKADVPVLKELAPAEIKKAEAANS